MTDLPCSTAALAMRRFPLPPRVDEDPRHLPLFVRPQRHSFFQIYKNCENAGRVFSGAHLTAPDQVQRCQESGVFANANLMRRFSVGSDKRFAVAKAGQESGGLPAETLKIVNYMLRAGQADYDE